MTVTAHVYQIHIAADADQVWRAITESDWTRRYLHTTTFVDPPVAGARYRTVTADGRDAIDGVIEQMQPPGPGTPGRFVQTWHVLYDAALAEEPPGRVEWTVEQVGEGLTRVRLVHGDLAASPRTWASVKDGWVWILDGLKTVVETDRELPPVEVEPTEDSDPDDGAWHRIQGIAATNEALELLGQERGDAADERLLRLAYAAAYHWDRAAGRTPANEARAAYLVSRALTATGQPERALVSADRCLALCAEHGLTDFDLAYSHEARARALHALGRFREAVEEWDRAQAVEIADPEDRALVESDFARLSLALG